jgi:uncharacterized protein
MDEVFRIPMFPLAILPLPGELVPLHIFEPRYQELLQDAESHDIKFGIYLSHEINTAKIGSLMKLESIIKRYPGGESDIIVKCEDILSLDMLLRKYKTKLYPGGDVRFWKIDLNLFPHQTVYELFLEYLKLRNINQHHEPFNLYQIANELGLDLQDRYRFIMSDDEKKESFLQNQIRFQIRLLQEEERSKDSYHLN